jgi:hypothetical protein
LKIDKKVENFDQLFLFKAINLSGITLKNQEFAQIQTGKYVQIIAITYHPNKEGKSVAKNQSLGYFGKAEKLNSSLKKEIIEFILRWRYEKAFQQVEAYEQLLSKLI